jgi:hypothetical protein
MEQDNSGGREQQPRRDGANHAFAIPSRLEKCASSVKKRGLQAKQYIGPLYPCPMLGLGAVRVLVVVPHVAHVPRLRVVSCGEPARLSLIKSHSSWSGPRGVEEHRRGHFFSQQPHYLVFLSL